MKRTLFLCSWGKDTAAVKNYARNHLIFLVLQ